MADVEIPKRALFKSSEVCEIAGVQPYVLRSWESEFPNLGLSKSAGGPRMYRRADVERVLHIKQLVFADGLTLAGVRRRIDEEAPPVLEEADAAPIKELLGRNAKRTARRGEARTDGHPRHARTDAPVKPACMHLRPRLASPRPRNARTDRVPPNPLCAPQQKNDAVSGRWSMGPGRRALVCLVYGLSGRPFMRGACARWHGPTPMTDYRLVTDDHRLSTITAILAAVLMFGMAGLLAELALIAHYEDVAQLIPIALLTAGLFVLSAELMLARGWTQLLLQLTMVLFVASGALGVYFHFQGSREFQVEMDPQMRGTTLVWHVLRAKSPPTLAPGSMVQLGILGLGYSYLRRTR